MLLWALGAVFSVLPADVAGAQDTGPGANPEGDVRIIEVSGLIDPVVKDFLLQELKRAEEQELLAVVLQVNSLGSVLSDADFLELARRLKASPVAIAYWVGPSGSSALGGTAELAGVADIIGVAGGSGIGDTGPARLPSPEFPPAFGSATERLQTVAVGAEEARAAGLFDEPLDQVSVLGTFLTAIPGYETELGEDGSLVAVTGNEFVKLPLTNQLFHTMGSPEVSYLFFTGGIALLIFELYTAGVGLAGLIGAVMLLFGCYGFANLPTRPWAIALFIIAFLAMTIDIQTNIPGLYTIIGLICFVLATFFIWDGITMSWVTGLVGIVGAGLYAYLGMPTMVRTRFSSPVIGRRWMTGSVGRVLGSFDSQDGGTVEMFAAKWRAKPDPSSEAANFEPKQDVKVVRVEKYTLIVEPVSGS